MWDGASWSVDASGTTSAGRLGDVSCSSATSCFAVGSKGQCCGSQTTFIRRWNAGAWFTVPSPTPANSGYTLLRSVSCTAWNACTAVGDTSNKAAAPLIERWNGTAWSIVAGASTGDYASLSSVSCSSSTSCVAVGVDAASNGAFIEQWDGSTWTIVPTAHRPGATFDYLWGVSCLSSTECFATGYAQTDLYSYTFVERSALRARTRAAGNPRMRLHLASGDADN
jgi:hypothetical protein